MPPEPTFLPCFPCTCATSPWVSLSPSLLYPSTPAVLPIPSLRHGRCRPSSLLLFRSSPSSIRPQRCGSCHCVPLSPSRHCCHPCVIFSVLAPWPLSSLVPAVVPAVLSRARRRFVLIGVVLVVCIVTGPWQSRFGCRCHTVPHCLMSFGVQCSGMLMLESLP